MEDNAGAETHMDCMVSRPLPASAAHAVLLTSARSVVVDIEIVFMQLVFESVLSICSSGNLHIYVFVLCARISGRLPILLSYDIQNHSPKQLLQIRSH